MSPPLRRCREKFVYNAKGWFENDKFPVNGFAGKSLVDFYFFSLVEIPITIMCVIHLDLHHESHRCIKNVYRGISYTKNQYEHTKQ